MKHETLARKVLNIFAKNNDILSNQINLASTKEECDEVGFFINFEFRDKRHIKPIITKDMPDVYGLNKEGKTIVGFVLFITDGYIEMLKGYTFGNEKWPDSDEDIILEVAQ